MLVSVVNSDKPKRLIGLNQKVSGQVRGLPHHPTRMLTPPAYRADLNHPVTIAEHGNAASLARSRDRADLTARRVRGRSTGRTEKANASGNALDMPTSVWPILAKELAELSSEEESK